MAKNNKNTFKLIVKDGDYKYHRNEKTGAYDYKTTDLVEEFDNLADALFGLLEYTQDEYNENTVSLKFVPAKKK